MIFVVLCCSVRGRYRRTGNRAVALSRDLARSHSAHRREHVLFSVPTTISSTTTKSKFSIFFILRQLAPWVPASCPSLALRTYYNTLVSKRRGDLGSLTSPDPLRMSRRANAALSRSSLGASFLPPAVYHSAILRYGGWPGRGECCGAVFRPPNKVGKQPQNNWVVVVSSPRYIHLVRWRWGLRRLILVRQASLGRGHWHGPWSTCLQRLLFSSVPPGGGD